jgi:protein-disulfide isomerase
MEHNDNSWVDERLAKLDSQSGWQPNAGAALTRLRQRDRDAATRRKWRKWLMVAALAECLVFAIPFWNRIFPPHANGQPGAPERPVILVQANSNFRETGSANAPILCEIYSDYECAHCAAFFLETVPQLTADFVRTGKVRLLHRDLPHPDHPHSGLAARYANAAGRIGRYDLAVDRIFRTQQIWAGTGDLDGQLAATLPPGDMARIRELVRNSEDLDQSVNADIEMGRNDHVTLTPSMVVVANGKRQVLAPVPSYDLLKGYLDRVLETNCREDPKATRC